jgi:hypothetical protein
VNGSGSESAGARYLSQFTIRWKNLSAPKRIGATVKAARRIMKACSAGSAARIRASGPALERVGVDPAWVLVMVSCLSCW